MGSSTTLWLVAAVAAAGSDAPGGTAEVTTTPQATAAAASHLEGSMRLGSGADSNLLRRPSAGPWVGTTVAAGELVGNLGVGGHLSASARHERPVAHGNLWCGEAAVALGWRWQPQARVALVAASRSTAERDLTVLAGGAVIGADGTGWQRMAGAQLREALVQTAVVGFDLGPRWLRLEGRGRGELKGVRGAERYRLLVGGGTVGVRLTWSTHVAARLAYGYRAHQFDGLVQRNLHGVALHTAPDTLLGVHGVTASWHLRLREGLEAEVRYGQQRFEDNLLGYLDGADQRLALRLSARLGTVLSAELQAAGSLRTYAKRVASPGNHDRERSGELAASLTYWIWDGIGVHGSYGAEVVTAAPLGTLYRRHALVFGPAGRFGHE